MNALFGLRWQTKRDTVFAPIGGFTTSKAPSPLRFAGAVQNPLLLVLLLIVPLNQLLAQSAITNTVPVHFRTVDISLDTKDKPLAAYQLEFSATAGDVKIVGIEGGEHPAFAQPPFYDPKAMQHDRVIIAAFSTETVDKLPKGKTRVATVHVQIKGAGETKFELKLHTSADSGGKKVASEAIFEERKAK